MVNHKEILRLKSLAQAAELAAKKKKIAVVVAGLPYDAYLCHRLPHAVSDYQQRRHHE